MSNDILPYEHKMDIAYYEGRQAYYRGNSRQDNPYETLGDGDRSTAWFLGWDHAKSDDTALKKQPKPSKK